MKQYQFLILFHAMFSLLFEGENHYIPKYSRNFLPEIGIGFPNGG